MDELANSIEMERLLQQLQQQRQQPTANGK